MVRELAVVRSTREAGLRQAGQYLRELLRREPYRRRWLRFGAERERVRARDAAAEQRQPCG